MIAAAFWADVDARANEKLAAISVTDAVGWLGKKFPKLLESAGAAPAKVSTGRKVLGPAFQANMTPAQIKAMPETVRPGFKNKTVDALNQSVQTGVGKMLSDGPAVVDKVKATAPSMIDDIAALFGM